MLVLVVNVGTSAAARTLFGDAKDADVAGGFGR